MNIAFALDFIPRRMKELGYGENYITRYRHILVESGITQVLQVHNQYLYFISPEVINVSIRSKRGIFNLLDYSINEQQHEHSGKVEINNLTGQPVFALFIQVIPQNKSKHENA